MAKRRRRFKIKCSGSLFELILISLFLLLCLVEAHYEQSPSEQQTVEVRQQNLNNYLKQYNTNTNFNLNDQQQQKSTTSSTINQVVASHEHQQQQQQQQQQVAIPSIAHLCSHVLPGSSAKHLKLCKLIGQSASADEAVVLGAGRGLAECRAQFRSERWNCTHAHGDHHLLTSRQAQAIGTRESGFVQAIAAAGIVHAVATACSSGALSDCACDKTRIGLIRQRDQIWKWGGCSNNIRHGMLYAKHLVELLDALHSHQQHQADHLHLQLHLNLNHHQPHHQAPLTAHHRRLAGATTGQQQQQRKLAKRSLAGPGQRRPQSNAITSRAGAEEQQPPAANSEPGAQAALNFCQSNQNISQTTHIQLIKSLLAKNSLEKHQDFRLAMNMHNNKVGRMAVARNMDIKCRCHGLSGSCSLKTCWLKLPDFQQVGLYLRRKYEASVHLPSAVNVNRLIPMMDRNELSAILSASDGQQPAGAGGPLLELAAAAPVNVPAHFVHYERHKQQLEQLAGSPPNGGPKATLAAPMNNQTRPAPNETSSSPASASASPSPSSRAHLISDEIPVNQIAPMSQQQYQALLKEMKLCNSVGGQQQAPSYLTTRELQQQQQQQEGPQAGAAKHRRPAGQHTQPGGQHQSHQSHLRLANQALGQLLHAQNNKDDLVHLHRSPDYCEADARHGFAGVRARVCAGDNPAAPDSCDKLCCGRGHEKRRRQLYYSCECQFLYCCSIGCKTCAKEIVEHVCR